MERSQSDPSWDDGNEGDDRHVYPPAPVPAHERTWRHPSEVGEAVWTMTEPPLVIGRGLTITTGAIGCALGVAVLWLMLPSRGGFAPTAASSAVGLRGAPSTVVAAADPTVISASPITVPDTTPDSTLTLEALFGNVTLPAEDVPSNTVRLAGENPVDLGDPVGVAIAVTVDEAPFLVTTAYAVSGRSEVRVVLDSGDETMAPVVSVDEHLAYLSPLPLQVGVDADLPSTGTVSAGDTVTVLTGAPTSLRFGDAAAIAALDAQGVLEGTPVVDEDGAIVALCTRRSGSVELVPVATVQPAADPATARPTVAADPAPWIGIHLGGIVGADDMAITAVTDASPADDAGLVVGDVVIAVDGTPVESVDDLSAALAGRRPGDPLDLRVRRTLVGDVGAEREVSLVLGERAPLVSL